MSETRHIQVLPDEVANMIAAGEVVDRPSSVVKELMENSIDAGSTQVDVEIVSGGRKLIAVSDNGSGMGRDDALLSIERHATNKIRDVHDIERIATMGFRGEALAAICSVSRFRLKTCGAGDVAGTEIVVSGGKLQDVREAGGPAGTRVEVRDLFFNVPARRKFLRTEQTELSHVRQFFIVQAIARPATGMSLTVDGREMYRLAGKATLEDRLREIFGTEYQRSLRRVDYQKSGVRLYGYVSAPAASRSGRDEQFFFVNERPTGSPLLAYAIREGYHSLLPAKRHPSVFLFLFVDPALVDVNVHPTKKEVRFRRSAETRDAVIEAIRKALSAGESRIAAGQMRSPGLAPLDAPAESPILPPHREVQLAIEDLPATRSFQYPRMPMISGHDNVEPVTQSPQADTVPEKHRTEAAKEIENASPPWSWCRVLGQVGGLYVLMETEDGLVTMDPHAAHERVLYERFMADVLNGRVESQGLLAPETVELMPADALRVRKNIELFRKMGFGISEFGGDTFVVDALPAYFAGTSPQTLLIDIANSLQQAGMRGGAAAWKEEAIAQAACKASVKAHDKMTLEEIERLVIDLANTEMPYTCPHGRPTLIFTSFSELNRKFGRALP